MRQPCLIIALLSCLLLAACGKPEPAKPASNATPAATTPALSAAAHAQLAQLTQQTQALAQAAQTLSATPDDAHLKAAQSAWQAAYASFNQSLPWRLGNPSNLQRIEHRHDPLPIQPGYVDALKQWPDSGLVNDPTVTLDATTLVQQNQPTDDTEASLGFQVIEFLLWGSADLPRKADDFTQSRRALYLTLVTQQLVDDMATAVARCEQSGCDEAQGRKAAQARLDSIKQAAASQDAWLSPRAAQPAEKALGNP